MSLPPELWQGSLSLPELTAEDPRPAFADLLYGPLPPPPDTLELRLDALGHAERLEITVSARDAAFTADAALFRLPGVSRAPLIVGLDFTGPIGILPDRTFPLDPEARVYTSDGDRLADHLRGRHAYRWPLARLIREGFAVLVACYGSWAPDDPRTIETHGLKPLLGDTGAISLWAWTLLRLIDAAEWIMTPTEVIAVGHSRLGKAALWAAANDPRIGTVFANEAGAGGTAPARHPVGETLPQMADAYPHWIRPQTAPLPVDQHQLMSCLAPRRLYVASAEEDVWADPLGTYAALLAASRAWPDPPDWPDPETMWRGTRRLVHPKLGHHVRPGGHDLTAEDWDLFLDWFRRSG